MVWWLPPETSIAAAPSASRRRAVATVSSIVSALPVAWARTGSFPWRGKSFAPHGEGRGEGNNRVVFDAIRLHVERGYSSDARTWLSRTGRGHLDWGNMTDTYFRPALERVFAGTGKAALVHAAPGILRKSAITWWLQSGVTTTVAADWAGHSEEVMNAYYASRSSLTWDNEAQLLQGSRSTSGASGLDETHLSREAS